MKCWCFSVNTREVNQPPQTLTLRAAHDQVFRLTPFGMKDSRTKRSPPVLPPLASTQLPHGSQPSCNSGFPHAVMLAHIFREVSGVCKWNPRSWLCFGSGTSGSLVRNRLGAPIRVPTLSGNCRSAHRLGFPPLKGLGARLRVRPPCLQAYPWPHTSKLPCHWSGRPRAGIKS